MEGMFTNEALHSIGHDIFAAAVSLLLLGGYRVFIARKLRGDPLYTVQAVHALGRSLWVRSVMGNPGKDVLAVQTLRNSVMGPTFLASTAVLLIIGTLTLSGQTNQLSASWHEHAITGSPERHLFVAKLALLLFDFIVAFFAFTMAIRTYVHLGYLINLPREMQQSPLTPEYVIFHINRAGRLHTLGIRAYYYAVPLVFWLFGPYLMLAASLALVIMMHRLDRSPNIRTTTE